MSTLTNPSEIARETLRLLAARRTPPTPDNYLTIYHEISGTKAAADPFPERELRTLANALPKSSPDQLRLARQLDEAVKKANWEDYRAHLVDFISALAETQKLGWSQLINDLIQQWDAKHSGLTTARKRDSLEHVLSGAGTNPEKLHGRLQSLIRSWGQGKDSEPAAEAELPPPPAATLAPQASAAAGSSNLQAELRELFAFTLESAIASQLAESPQLASDARQLASDIRRTTALDEFQAFFSRLKSFAFKMELLTEDQTELRNTLLNLLRLLVENVSELAFDDQWLHGQIEVIRDLIAKPLSQRALDDAERRLKEVIFKQGQLKVSLQEAKDSLKRMLAGFVDQLADFAEVTSEYHDKIEVCAEKITAANDISELGNVLGEVMKETRTIQLNARHARDELRSTQQKVQESESRIRQLERELEASSELVRHDQLTGVLNRRGLEDMFEKEMSRAQRHDTTLCVALLDIDNFKKLNDTLGHDTGDQALIHLAHTCREALRPQDTVARYGGEEFIILLPETRLDEAVTTLTRLQRELTKRFFLHDNDKVLITFSAGVTEVHGEDSQHSAIKRADEAMYEAKRTGKNRVVTTQPT